MEKKFIQIKQKLTYDKLPSDKENFIPPSLDMQIPELHKMAIKGKKSNINKLNRLIKQYPNLAVLKNYLSTTYTNAGNIIKARQINDLITEKHPNYFFGKLNKGFQLLDQKKIKEIPVLLDNFNLIDLYPNRKQFHITEVLGMLKIAILYSCKINDFEEAKKNLDFLKEIDIEGIHYEETSSIYSKEIFRVNREKFAKEIQETITPTVKAQQITSITKAPKFKYSFIQNLYTYGFDLDCEKTITQIQQLPRKEIILDLEKVIQDSIDRFYYFESNPNNNHETLFLVHSIGLLAEINAPESLPIILNCFSQSNEYLEFYFDDLITEYLWNPISKLAENNLESLTEFLYLPGINTYAKNTILEALEYIASTNNSLYSKITLSLEDLLLFFSKEELENNTVDSDFISFLISSLITLGGTPELQTIEILFTKGYISKSICGDFEDLKDDLLNPSKSKTNNVQKSMASYYKHILNNWYFEENDSTDDFKLNDFEYDTLFDDMPVASKKIGRNDPCTCGSGKKHKKCCLNKN